MTTVLNCLITTPVQHSIHSLSTPTEYLPSNLWQYLEQAPYSKRKVLVAMSFVVTDSPYFTFFSWNTEQFLNNLNMHSCALIKTIYSFIINGFNYSFLSISTLSAPVKQSWLCTMSGRRRKWKKRKRGGVQLCLLPSVLNVVHILQSNRRPTLKESMNMLQIFRFQTRLLFMAEQVKKEKQKLLQDNDTITSHTNSKFQHKCFNKTDVTITLHLMGKKLK